MIFFGFGTEKENCVQKQFKNCGINMDFKMHIFSSNIYNAIAIEI